MPKGVIRRAGTKTPLGRWQASLDAITVETEDPDLRQAADEVLSLPILIPHHPPEKFRPAGPTEAAFEPPSKLKYLALFALELEARGFEVEQEE